MVRKLAVVVLAVAMLMSCMGLASAAKFPDTAGHKQEAAIDRIASLGLVKGYPDGTFKPDAPITRAEFAKVMVCALGLETAAEMMATTPTVFADVPVGYWATGYINVAASQGIVNGYPDGTFKPDANVTYAEALKMVLCALGYKPEVFPTVVWPVTWVAKAMQLGITSGVALATGAASLPATRADIARLVDNALTVDKLVQKGYGAEITYEVKPGETLLKDLGYTKVEGFLLSSPELFGVADKIKVWTDKDSNWAIGTDELVELGLLADTKYQGLLGHKVRAWKNADGDVFSIEDLTAASDVKVAKVGSNTLTVDGTALTDADLVSGGAFVVLNWQCNTADRKTRVVDAVYGLYNAVQGADNSEVTLIYSGGKVVAAFGTQLTTRVVDSVSTGFQSMAFTSGSGGGTLSVKDKIVRYVGAASKLDEIQKDDVVEYTEATVGTKTYLYIVVTRNPKSGEFSRLVDGTTADKVTVGGTEYTCTFNNADANLLGKQVTILLNKHGKVVAMKSAAVDTKLLAAMKGNAYYVDTAEGRKWYLRLVKTDGTEVRLQVAKGAFSGFDPETATAATFSGANLVDKSIVEYSLNSDGAISSVSALIPGTAAGTTLSTYKDYNQIDAGDGQRALVVADTAIFNITESVTGRPKPVTLAQLMGDSSITGQVVLKTGTRVAKAIAIIGGFDAPVATTYGLVMGSYRTSGDKYYLSINVKGTTTDYEVVSDRVYAADTVVKFNPADAANTVTSATELSVSNAVYVWKVQEIDSANKLVYIDEYDKNTGLENPTDRRTAILILPDTQVFNLNGGDPATLARFEDIAVGQEVRVYYDAAAPGVAKVFVIVE